MDFTRIEQRGLWRRLERANDGALAAIMARSLDDDLVERAQEPYRLRAFCDVWLCADVALRRRMLEVLGVPERALGDATVAALVLCEVPYSGRSRCRPDLALVLPAGGTVEVLAILEGKSRALAAMNRLPAERAFGTGSTLAGADPGLLAIVEGDGWVTQTVLYRWAPALVYPTSWRVGKSTRFVLLTPGGYEADGWSAASLEDLAELCLEVAADGSHPAADVCAEAVARHIAPSRRFTWRAGGPGIRTVAYHRLSLAASWRVWSRKAAWVWDGNAPFGIGLIRRGWWPVGASGAAIPLASCPPDRVARYATALSEIGDRPGWESCRWEGCGQPAAAECGCVDVYGSHVSRRPAPLVVAP